LLDRYPRQLSGGQRQRVAMGRAIVRDPQVFLFDEPLSNLDAKLRVAMRTEIKELHQRLKTTSIYVTHDQIEAMTMADKIVVMRDGIVEQTGAPLELYDRPVNTFVAGIHRLAGDEHAPGVVRRNGAGTRVALAGAANVRDRRPRRRTARSSTASGPSISRWPSPRRASPPTSSSSSPRAPIRRSSAASAARRDRGAARPRDLSRRRPRGPQARRDAGPPFRRFVGRAPRGLTGADSTIERHQQLEPLGHTKEE
jgi:hypothetical protein